jgi:superfamily II DNA or RNA helicase
MSSAEQIERDAEHIDNLIRQDIAGSHDRTQSIFKKLLNLFRTPDSSILYFAPTVQDALTMAFLLRVEGISAECVHAETPAGLRDRHINNFKRGHVRVLCNVEILTTGFDAPRVTHVVIARPTVSRVLYEQIVGRGLRGPKFGGTESCTIIDCVDTIDGSSRLKFGYEYFREDWGITHVPDYIS